MLTLPTCFFVLLGCDFERRGTFPGVVNPHGGPIARDYWRFDLWAQMLVHHGCLVIQPQYRISIGFGRKHLEAGYAKWGLEMQDDLDDAIGYLAERKLADPSRASILGWSYGGYAALVGSFRGPNPYRAHDKTHKYIKLKGANHSHDLLPALDADVPGDDRLAGQSVWAQGIAERCL